MILLRLFGNHGNVPQEMPPQDVRIHGHWERIEAPTRYGLDTETFLGMTNWLLGIFWAGCLHYLGSPKAQPWIQLLPHMGTTSKTAWRNTTGVQVPLKYLLKLRGI